MTTGQRTEGRSLAYAAWVALIVVIVVVTAAGFALTFHGLLGYGRDLARLGHFAFLVPVMTDGLTIVAIMATFLLAYVAAPWRPKLYAWLVFGVANCASVAGNTSFALHVHLSWQGAAGAALCPVFVALSAHLAIICWRYWGARPSVAYPLERPAAQIPVSRNRDAGEGSVQPVPIPPVRRVSGRSAQPVPAHRDEVRRLYAAGVGNAEIRTRLNGRAPSARTINLWTADLREVHAKAKADAQAELAEVVQ